MLYNFRYPIILFLASFILFLISMLLKTMYWPGGVLVSWAGIIVQVNAIGWLMTKFFKSWYPWLLFLAGFIVFLTGLVFKIMHWPNARLVIVSMIIVQIISITWLIVIILKKQE
jgi:hypothetical protein